MRQRGTEREREGERERGTSMGGDDVAPFPPPSVTLCDHQALPGACLVLRSKAHPFPPPLRSLPSSLAGPSPASSCT